MMEKGTVYHRVTQSQREFERSYAEYMLPTWRGSSRPSTAGARHALNGDLGEARVIVDDLDQPARETSGVSRVAEQRPISRILCVPMVD